MPGLNGKGPQGDGPLTGGKRGKCMQAGNAASPNQGQDKVKAEDWELEKVFRAVAGAIKPEPLCPAAEEEIEANVLIIFQ